MYNNPNTPKSAPRPAHQGAPQQFQPYAHHAPNAALLIDFDNVTMGIRSDLGKELKALLNSEVIRGKVAVQRAYADWRRYPQYIVPLAESSIDLIFAPAYGSSKKNATDLRMAIDAIELVFTRPEIGTYILMTGDSDFSSCVLKLKEYGKYVIGVGMRESSSDLLIQNCDEYYSYHALSGLTRTGEGDLPAEDPWELVKRAVAHMISSGDVMRTDRLKQVMLDLDPAFDEKEIGYSKFSRFVNEAATKGLVRLRKGENGQYEISATDGEAAPAERPAREPSGRDDSRRRGRGPRDRDQAPRAASEAREEAAPAAAPSEPARAEAAAPAVAEPTAPAQERARSDRGGAPPAREAAPAAETPAASGGRGSAAEPGADTGSQQLQQAYALLQQALRQIGGGDGSGVRDGDLKRKMLEISPGFNESTLGFSKFTRFLRQAHDAEVIDLNRVNGGNYEVSLPASGRRVSAPEPQAASGPEREVKAAEPGAPTGRGRGRGGRRGAAPSDAAPAEHAARDSGETTAAAASSQPAAAAKSTPAPTPSEPTAAPRPTLGALRGRRSGRPGASEGPPPLLPGQVISAPASATLSRSEPAAPAAQKSAEQAPAAAAEAAPSGAPAKKSRSRGRGRGGAKAAAPAEATPAATPPSFSAPALGLPQGRNEITTYLSNEYKGIGKKTAHTLLDALGDDLFRVMEEEPKRINELLDDRRASTLLEQWSADHARRREAEAPAKSATKPAKKSAAKSARQPAKSARGAAKSTSGAAKSTKSAAKKTGGAAKKAASKSGQKAEPAADAPAAKAKSRRGGRGRGRGKRESSPS